MTEKIDLYYLEVINETEQLMIFARTFDKKLMGLDLVLNMALPVQVQDIRIAKIIERLSRLSRKTLFDKK